MTPFLVFLCVLATFKSPESEALKPEKDPISVLFTSHSTMFCVPNDNIMQNMTPLLHPCAHVAIFCLKGGLHHP